MFFLVRFGWNDPLIQYRCDMQQWAGNHLIWQSNNLKPGPSLKVQPLTFREELYWISLTYFINNWFPKKSVMCLLFKQELYSHKGGMVWLHWVKSKCSPFLFLPWAISVRTIHSDKCAQMQPTLHPVSWPSGAALDLRGETQSAWGALSNTDPWVTLARPPDRLRTIKGTVVLSLSLWNFQLTARTQFV